MRKTLPLWLLLLGAPARAGNPSADFLSYPLDVRALGMGEAATAVAAGADEVATNPAALNAVLSNHAYFTHSFLNSGIGVDYLSYGATLGKNHYGFSFHHVGYGTLQGIDDAGNATTNFGPSDSVYGFSYGTNLWGVETAAILKYIDSKIVSRASAVTFDLGGQYRLGESWRLGLAGQNLGGDLKYESQPFSLPTKVALGAGYQPLDNLWLTLDVVTPAYTPSYVAIGGEYVMPIAGTGKLAFRVGVNTKTPDLGAFSGVKVGFGFKFRSLDIDYALNPQGELGQAHHIGVGYRFAWPGQSAK